MKGCNEVAEVFVEELGIDFGQTTSDGRITLEYTPCIGMSDQAPAALINSEVVTCLSIDKSRELIRRIKEHGQLKEKSDQLGDGNNRHELVRSMVQNNIRKKGPIIFADRESESGLKRALSMNPEEVIHELKATGLRGRGGAGFPTGIKWEFTRAAVGERKFVICNADEGEPGTFKDRVILTERYDLLFEGMTIGGYAIGADAGLLYLRGEYAYLREFLEKMLQNRRDKALLGKNVLDKEGFNFDIRIQQGAGAYICGEETALISSCEGLRGDPKTRPPFPASKGYLGCSTTVNNVETFCCVARILEKGVAWFSEFGSMGSPGTKLLSVSGDCTKPGVYEFPFGIKISAVLEEAGASISQAVLVGGPSGQFIGPEEYERTICHDDLATGGAFVIFGAERNLLEAVDDYMEFFVEESCGYCTPCRVGNVLLRRGLEKIIAGKGEPFDLDYLQRLGETVKVTSRCGLGQTSPNPILFTLKNFRHLYQEMVKERKDGMQPSFDIKAAIGDAVSIAGHESVTF
jgi:[NiFe] hydrogenase diaphorase moiety large subunit